MKYKADEEWAEWVGRQHDSCCWYTILAGRDKDRKPFPPCHVEVYVGVVEYEGSDAYDWSHTWRGRLHAAWAALRGKLIGREMAFWERRHVEEFLADLREAVEFSGGGPGPEGGEP